MEKVDFHNEEQKKKFDSLIFLNPDSFIQQTTKWAEIVSPLSGDLPVFLYHETEKFSVTASLYLFNSPFGKILVSNIQAGSIGCIAFNGQPSDRKQAYVELFKKILRIAEEEKCITLTITSNPFSNDSELIKQVIKPETGMRSFISIIEIENFFNKNGEVVLQDYNRRSNLSRNLKKAYHQNFEFRTEKDQDSFDYWYQKVHSQRIEDLGGKPLSYNLLKNILFHSRTAEYSKFFTIYKDHHLIGGDICVFNKNGILDNFMMSTDREYQILGANYFLIDQILKWCYDKNFKIYNWQSTNPPKGGILRFKEQWGSKVKSYFYFTKILDQQKFDHIIRNNSFQKILEAFQGHFFAPFHTVRRSVYGIKSKVESQQIADL